MIDPYYRTKEWRELRKSVLTRDHHHCRYCGAVARTADHVTPRSRGGADHPDNLVAVCRSCNKAAGASVFTEFEAKRAWIRQHRKIIDPPATLPSAKRTKAPTAVNRRLTGFRRKLALKHRPDHVRDALLLS
jgi:5-methylcytosine-specific restriction endonuclease McrA